MNLDEARSLLGIDRSTDSATARRAYLRLLKQHPPERDPEGFKRVRAAYEAVQPFLQAASALQVAEPPPTSPAPTAPMATGEMQPDVVEVPPGTGLMTATPAPSLSELFWNEEDPAAQESMARAAVAREHSEEAYSLLLDALAERASDAEQLGVAREAMQYGHGDFLLMIGQRWPNALSDAELHLLGERAEGSPNWAQVACILIERGHAARAAQLALSELAREKRDPFAPQAGPWWLTRVVAGLLGSSELTPALQVFEAVMARADSGGGGIQPARLMLLRELVAVRPDLPDEVARILAKAIDSGEMERAGVDLGAFADTAEKATRASLRRLLKKRAPTLSSYYDKSLQGLASTFHEPWYRHNWGGGTVGFILFAVLRLAARECGSDRPNVPQVEMRPQATPDVEKTLCEDRGLLCDAAYRWAHAEQCGEMRLAFEDLQREWLRANTVATPSLRQQVAYSKAIKDTAALCPSPLTQGSPP